MKFSLSSFIRALLDLPASFQIDPSKKRGWDKNPSLSIIFGLSSKTQWLSGLYYADFISFYSPTQLCGGGTTKSNSNELPISVPLSLFLFCLIFDIKGNDIRSVLGCTSSKLVDVFLEFWIIDIAFADMAKNLYRAVKSIRSNRV